MQMFLKEHDRILEKYGTCGKNKLKLFKLISNLFKIPCCVCFKQVVVGFNLG